MPGIDLGCQDTEGDTHAIHRYGREASSHDSSDEEHANSADEAEDTRRPVRPKVLFIVEAAGLWDSVL